MYQIDILRIIFLITIAWTGSIIYRIEIAQTLTDEKWKIVNLILNLQDDFLIMMVVTLQ